VKLQFSQEDAWTRALRHVLLALKILLKWATSGSNTYGTPLYHNNQCRTSKLYWLLRAQRHGYDGNREW